jgi:hypothetical protein
MKKLIIAIVMMTAILSGCEDKVYYEHCDSWGNCVWSETPPDYYVYSPTPQSHSHSEDTYVYYDDSHNHNQVIIVEDNGYDPYYYEFTNNFQEFCYAEGTPYHTTTCWVEWCHDHWITNDWYVWDEWCE